MSSSDVFIVTGAGSGIGRAIATRLVAQGSRVFGLGRDVTKLRLTANDTPPDQYGFFAADLARPADISAAVTAARTWAQGAPIKGLVNNAGVFSRRLFLDTSDADWMRFFTHNLMSAVCLTRALYPDLKRAGGASVLNISSTVGLRPVAGTLAYAASKAALNSLTAGLALEWAPDRIRVNGICPGIVDTPAQAFNQQGDAPARATAGRLHPLGRLGTPADIAAAAVFLLSRESSWTTGATLTVDGGINL